MSHQPTPTRVPSRRPLTVADVLELLAEEPGHHLVKTIDEDGDPVPVYAVTRYGDHNGPVVILR